jgi:hypothetical protein
MSMLDSGSASSRTSSEASGAIVTPGPEAAPSSTSTSGTMPSTVTTSGIMVPSTCVSNITMHTTSVLGAMNTTRGRRHHHSLRTFHYGGLRRCSLCARRHGLGLGRGADSSTAGDGFFSAADVLGSSPSQDRSVDSKKPRDQTREDDKLRGPIPL